MINQNAFVYSDRSQRLRYVIQPSLDKSLGRHLVFTVILLIPASPIYVTISA